MLNSIFAAIRRLAASINHAADLFDAASLQIELRLVVADDEQLTLPAPEKRKAVRS